MPEIITRAEAKARGLKRYFTGKPCGYGHVCERYTENWGCCECRSEAYRRFVGSNPEQFRGLEREKYQRQRPQRLVRMRKYYAAHADKMSAKSSQRARKIADLLAVLRKEMPDLLKEFGL